MTAKKIKEAGQTLLETIIALGVGVAILSSIVVVVFVTLSATLFTKNQTLATQYSQAGMEQVRKLRDNDWVQFSGYDGSYCLSQAGTFTKLISASCPQNIGIFIRTVDFSWDAQRQRATVAVTVSWNDSKGQHFSKLVSYFTQYNSQR